MSLFHDETLHIDAPLEEFSECHHQFVSQLHAALYLPELVASAARARAMAADLIQMFRQGLLAHHQDEERELFPAVQHACGDRDEQDRVDAMVERLVREHRETEQLWQRLEPSISAVSQGQPAELNGALIEDLVQRFFAHVHYEEHEFLPLAQQILGRRHGSQMAALGMALHTRHEHD